MTPELSAVKEVLLDRLHTTEDEELGAALWQLLEDHEQLEARRSAAVRLLLRAEEVE
jgi:hypothetical protein